MATTLKTKDRDLQLEAIRVVKAQQDLLTFLDYVNIPDPPPAGTGIIKFDKWPHILKLHEAAEAVPPSGTLPLLKSRKVGATSYFEARDVWTASFQFGAFLPVISQGQTEARKVIADCKFIWEHLPETLRIDLIAENLDLLKFKGGGTIEAFPATTKAGRSFTGTEILFDEADFHENFSTSYDALLPLIGDTGGKLFLVSTANPEQVDSGFRQVYWKAPNRMFVGYYDRPGRNEEAYEAARVLASDESNFEKENARTEEEALKPPRASAYFDPDILAWMMQNRVIDPPLHQVGNLSVWEEPVVAQHYVLGSDTAWGKTGSFNGAGVFDLKTWVQVAELHGRMPPNDMAYELVALHKYYHHAYMGIERAGEGQERDGDSVVVVEKVLELLKDCPCKNRLFYADHLVDEPKKAGWVTDPRSRPFMFGELREAVRMRQITIRSRGGMAEMMNFIKRQDGRMEASKGAYDDRPVCYAIAWQMRKYARFIEVPNEPVYTQALW